MYIYIYIGTYYKIRHMTLPHKLKVTFHSVACHEGPEGDQKYSSTLSLTSAIDRVGGQRHAPAAPYSRKRPGTHFTGGWVGLRVCLDGWGKSRPHRVSIPGPSSQ
jgi:hypothetical protein